MVLFISLLSGMHTTTHTMAPWLFTLAGDASIAASISSLAFTKAGNRDKLQVPNFLKPTQLAQIFYDAQAIHPYAPLLLLLGIVTSAGTRVGMIAQAPVGGFVTSTILFPINATLIAATYALRIYSAPENAGGLGKAADWVQKIIKS